MPHYKCDGCRTRLHSAAAPTNAVGRLCPSCGSPLEPAGDLSELVGFRSITPAHAPNDLSALREAILSRMQ